MESKEEFIKYLVDILIYPDHFETNGRYQSFSKDGKEYFNYDLINDILYYSFDNVYVIFKEKYKVPIFQIKPLLKEMVITNFNMQSTDIR